MEQARTFVGTIGACAVHHNDRAMCRQTPVGQDAGDKPATQLDMIFPAGKGHIAVL